MTNGETWLLFETFQRVKADRVVWSINLLTDSIEKSVSLLGTLNYENIESLELLTKKNKTIDQLWQNLKSEKVLVIKSISDLLKSQIKLSNPDLTYQDKEIENFVSSKIEELFFKGDFSNRTSNVQTSPLNSSVENFEIKIAPSWRTHNCICFPTKKLEIFPKPGTEFLMCFNKEFVKVSIKQKTKTHIYGLTKFWTNNPTLNPDDKIRIVIIRKFEEYRIEII